MRATTNLPPRAFAPIKITNVAHVQQIEAAIGQCDPFPGPPPFLHALAELLSAQILCCAFNCDFVMSIT